MGYPERNPAYAGRQYPVSRVTHQSGISFLASFRFASEGLLYVFVTQRNFRVHLAIAAIVVALGLWLQLAPASWAILALTIGAVLVTEIFNTAAERLVDLVSPDYHPLAKQVKDLAAGAVLVSAIVSVIVGLLVLGPPLWAALRALRF